MTYLFLFLSVLLSGLAVFLFKSKNENHIKLLLAFSGAYLFAICVLHLIPETYSSGGSFIGIYILIGFLFQILLEFFSKGIEHGHINITKPSYPVEGINKFSHTTVPLTIFISLCIHAFVEGMPLGNSSFNNGNASPLLTGIILHKIPIAFVLMSLLIQSNVKKQIAIILLILFALMSPLGFFASNVIGEMELYFNEIMAIVIGIFLHISTTILFESTEDHRFNINKFITIIFGAGIAILTCST
ncbi:MAG: ZIP family metal transporter [Bacteroidota bacterium]